MASPRRIVFLLPGSGHVPVGGFKVVYEYAQGLSRLGYQTEVIHAALVATGAPWRLRAKATLGFFRRGVTGFRPASWFTFRAPVRLRWVPRFRAADLQGAEAAVATSWQTAEWLAGAALPSVRDRLYLIQHEETWSGDPERVHRTWQLPLRKIVISRWLQDLVRARGGETEYIPNGLDFERFGLDLAVEQRTEPRVAMLQHEAAWKGSDIGLRALRRAREEVPELTATLFGTRAAPPGLPAWCRYLRNPDQGELRRLYNETAVVLCPSLSEGWGLVGSEAMMCGCAVAATDIGGHREYARDGETALLCPPGDAEALASCLLRLLRDPALRFRLARRGHEEIRQFTWDRSVRRLAELLES